MKEKREVIKSFRFTESEVDMIENISNSFDENQTDVILNSLQLRYELIELITSYDSIDDEDIMQLQEILKIVLKSMNIPYQ